MKIPMLVIKLLLLGALFIVSNHDLRLADSEDREFFIEVYGKWFDGMVDQGSQVTAYVVKFEWLPPKNLSVPDRVVGR